MKLVKKSLGIVLVLITLLTVLPLTVSAASLKITTQPKNTYVQQGQTAKVTVAAQGDGLKYQWYVKNAGSSKYTKSSVTKASYSTTMSDASNGRYIYCVVSDQYGNTVKSKTVVMRQAATIVTQPKTAYAAMGETVKVSVKAVGDGLTYQWYIKNASGTKYSKSSVTKATYSTTMSDAADGRYVYCVVTDKYGKTAKSNTVRLMAEQSLAIKTQPKNTYVQKNETATVTIAAQGDGLKYQWYIKNAGSTKYTKSSVTKATYSTTMDDKSNGRYIYCMVTDRYGNTVKSKTVVLRMAATIVTQPKTGYAQLDKTVKVSVKAEGDGLTYQWYVKNAGASKYSKSSITKSTYSATMSETTRDRLVYCVVTDKYGNSVKSKTVALRMSVTITEQPGNVFGLSGQTISVDVTAVGDDLTYTWFSDRLYSGSFMEDNYCAYGPYYYVDLDYDYYHEFEVFCVITDKYGKQVQTDTVSVLLSPVDYSTIAGRWFPTEWYYDDGTYDYDTTWDIYIYSDATLYIDFNSNEANVWHDLDYYWISGYKHYFNLPTSVGDLDLCYHEDTGELWLLFSNCETKLVRYY